VPNVKIFRDQVRARGGHRPRRARGNIDDITSDHHRPRAVLPMIISVSDRPIGNKPQKNGRGARFGRFAMLNKFANPFCYVERGETSPQIFLP